MIKAVRVFYSVLLFAAGVLHFVHERSFRRIVPKQLPFRRAIVLVSGAFEILFSILLWVKKGQRLTSKLLAIFMIVVFPANIYMAVKKISFIPGKTTNPLILRLRLPLQIPLILGALALGKKKGNE
ncbi:DoxX family protein [Alteribacter lacisalsi]|uniref:DoxX family protein n=1 Tax=Alteribacter lacisalsi TaxID=2045244 RepID=UPI001F29AB62|nr:DoxX family membrane protein [Alteribacter lacisalsi]